MLIKKNMLDVEELYNTCFRNITNDTLIITILLKMLFNNNINGISIGVYYKSNKSNISPFS
jgi:hypothetical protein